MTHPPNSGLHGLEVGDGEGEGLGLGFAVGDGLGDGDGEGEGLGLGFTVGDGLGDGDFEGDGDGLGELDAEGDGDGDGLAGSSYRPKPYIVPPTKVTDDVVPPKVIVLSTRLTVPMTLHDPSSGSKKAAP